MACASRNHLAIRSRPLSREESVPLTCRTVAADERDAESTGGVTRRAEGEGDPTRRATRDLGSRVVIGEIGGRLEVERGERRTVPLVGPFGALAAQARMKPDPEQRPLDAIEILALFEQRECHAASAPSRVFDGCLGELRVDPVRMFPLERVRESVDVTPIDGWHIAPHRKGAGFQRAREIELCQSVHAAHEW